MLVSGSLLHACLHNQYGQYISGGTVQYTRADGTVGTAASTFGTGFKDDALRAFILLHELGHLTAEKSGFVSDSNDPQKQIEHNEKVKAACFPDDK